MTKYLIIPLVLITQSAFSQNETEISKVILEYNVGAASWNKSGVYAKTETIEITKTDGGFYISRNFQVNQSFDEKSKIHISDTILLKKPKKTIRSLDLYQLLNELNTAKNNFTTDYLLPNLKKISRKEAKTISLKYNLEGRNNKSALRKLKQYDSLSVFLKLTVPSPNEYSITTDTWNSLSIFVIRSNDTTQYKNQFLQLLGQPFWVVKGSKKTSSIINLEINNRLLKILPDNLILKKQLDFNSLKEEYIKWYLQKYK